MQCSILIQQFMWNSSWCCRKRIASFDYGQLSSFHLLYCIYLLYVSFYSFVSATLRGEIKLCVTSRNSRDSAWRPGSSASLHSQRSAGLGHVLGLARKQTLVRSRREDRWRRINAVAEIRYQRPARTCGQTRSSATCGLPTSFTRGLNLQSFQDPWAACEKLSTTTDSECKIVCLFQKRCAHWFGMICIMPPSGQAALTLSIRSSVHLCVPSFVTKFWTRYFGKGMDRFWCQLAQTVHGERARNDQLWCEEVKGQRSRSHEAEDRFGDLAETLFSTPLGRVA